MALQKQTVEVSLAGGIDTKTDQKLVQGKLLELVNAEMANGIIVKTTGYDSVADSSTSTASSYAKQIAVSYEGGLQVLDNNSTYHYDKSTDTLIKDGEMSLVDRSDITIANNIKYDVSVNTYNVDLNQINVCMGEYGDRIAIAYHESPYTPVTLTDSYIVWSVKEINKTTSEEVARNVIVKNLFFSTVEEVVCTQYGYAVFMTKQDFDGGPISRVMYMYRYGGTAPYTTITLYAVSTGEGLSTEPRNRGTGKLVPQYNFPTIRAIYDNNNIYIAHIEPKTPSTDGSWWVQLSVYNADTGALKSSIRNQNFIAYESYDTFSKQIGDAYFCFSLSSMTISSVKYICLTLGGFAFNLYTGTDTLTLSRQVSSPTGFADSSSIVLQIVDSAYFEKENSIALLGHVCAENLTEGAAAYCPKVMLYNLTTNTWNSESWNGSLYLQRSSDNFFTYTDRINPNYPNLGASTLGFRSIIMCNGVPCFVLLYCPWLSNKSDSTTPSTTVSTPFDERRATLILMDYKYNVIDKLADYDVGLAYFHLWDGDYSSPLVISRNSSSKAPSSSTVPLLYKAQEYEAQIVSNGFVVRRFSYTLKCVQYSWPANNQSSRATSGNTVYMSNNIVRTVGKSYEMSFYDFPQLIVYDSTISGLVDRTKVYQYAAVYVWTSPSGELVRSSPSIIKTTTASSANGSYFVKIAHPPYFSKRTGVAIEIYRTKGNGSILYHLHTLNQYSNGTDFRDTRSVLPIWYSGFTDGAPDSSLNGKILYTTGSVLPEMQFPSIYRITNHNSRVFAIPNASKNTILYSKERVADVALSSHPALSIMIESRGGDIVELASLDDKLIVFKKDYIYYILGDGASNTGEGVSFSIPSLINSPVGCSEPGSVVRIPSGILFKSSQGIYLLDRSLQVSYKGADVERYNQYTITSSVAIPDRNVVKFCTSQGYIISYNYYYDTWNVEDNLPFQSSVLHEGRFTGILSNSKIYKNNPSSYKRAGSHYSMTVRTSWLRIAGLQGFQRAYEFEYMGDYKDSHVMNCAVAYNYDQTTESPHVLATTDTFTSGKPYQFRVFFSEQKCESVQLTFSDTPSGTGQSFTITGLTFTVGVKSGKYKLPTGKTTSL